MSFDPSTAVLLEEDAPAFDPSSATPLTEFDASSAMPIDDTSLPAPTPSAVPQPDKAIDSRRDAERNGQAAADQDIKEGIFPAGSTPWKTIDGRLYIDPARYNMAVEQMWKLGVIDSANYTSLLKGTVDQWDEASQTYIPSVEKATAARRDLERRAGAYPEAKAAASGLLKGAMQAGAAIVAGPAAAAATSFTGPGAVAVGLTAGTGAVLAVGAAYDKALEASAKESDLLDSFYAANQLRPGYNFAGQLVSILAPTPVSVSRLANAANLIRVEKGAAEAAKFITGALGTGAAIGAATDATVQAANMGLDRLVHPEINDLMAAAEYYKSGEQPHQRPKFDPASTAISGTLGALTAGIGVKARNKTYAPEELVTLESQVRTGRASRQEAEDYNVMRQAVETLRSDDRLIDAQAIRRATVDAAGFRFLDTTEIINPRFQQAALADAGFTPRLAPPAIPYATENSVAAIPIQGQSAAYTGQAFLNRGGAASAFQGGSSALPGPEGIPALPAPAAVPPVVSNDTFDPSTATEIPPEASAPVASATIAPEVTGSPEVIAGEGPSVFKPKRSFARLSYDPGTFPVLAALQESPVRPSTSGKAGGENDIWDSMRRTGRHFAETHSRNGTPYDVRAQELYDQGLIKEPTADALANAYLGEIKSYRSLKDGDPQEQEYNKLQRQYDNFAKAALEPAKSKQSKLEPISTSDLQVGDKVKVGDEWLHVKDIDPDNFTISLQDGAKFGLQKVEDGKQMWVQEKQIAEPSNDPFAFGETETKPVPPKHDPYSGNIFAPKDMPFSLDQPLEDDSLKRQREADAAKQRQAAYEEEQKNQQNLFSNEPARKSGMAFADAGPPQPTDYNIGIAPNGKPSNLNPEEQALARSQEFKERFGDWEILSKQVQQKLLGENAISTLLAQKSGKIVAMNRPGLGDITFLYGTPGKINKKGRLVGGGGLSHLIEQRNLEGNNGIAVAKMMPSVIAHGRVVERQSPETTGERVKIVYQNHTAILSRYQNGKPFSWLLTGWENEEGGEGVNPATAYASAPSGISEQMGASVDIDPLNSQVVNPESVTVKTDENGEPLASEIARFRNEFVNFQQRENKSRTMADAGPLNEPDFIAKSSLQTATVPVQITSVQSALEYAKQLVDRPMNNIETNMTANLSANSLGKIASGKAISKSANAQAHALATANIDYLFKYSQLIDSHSDKKGNMNMEKVHRFGTAMILGDKVYGVKITVHEYKRPSEGNRIYTVEAIDVEKVEPAGQLVSDTKEAVPNTPLTGSDKKVFQIVEKVKAEMQPSLNTYNDAQIFADYPDAVGVSRANNGVWTMPVILGGMDKVPAIELPEAVEFFKSLSGNSPIVRMPRKRGVLGTFTPAGKGYITLHPKLIAAGGEAAANMVFMHEAGHFIQFMDDFKMQKGNLLGIIAGAKNLKHNIPLDPNATPVEGWGYSQQNISTKQRETIRQKAEADLRASLEGEVRKVIVNEPVYAQSGVTPEIVKGLFGLDAREQWPELYDWFARQDGATKANIVKQAMKGILDSRLAKFQMQGEQIGTNTREEVQNIGGREPTPDEIREAFHAAMRAEMNARNVADLKYIRQELIDLTKWWKPFDMTKAPDDYIKYRFSPEELFADAMSVLLNSPADLKTRAPIFYDTFWNHLDSRPQVKTKLLDIYDRINTGRDQVMQNRQARDWQAYAKGDQAFLDAWNKANSRRSSINGLWDKLKDQYWDEFYPLTSTIEQGRKAGRLTAAEADPYRYLTEEHPMADGRLQMRLVDMNRTLQALNSAGITNYQLDDYLKYTRIANERYEVTKEVDGQMVTIGYEQSPTKFNPEGETKRTAQYRLDWMQKNLPAEKWNALQQAAKDFRNQFHEVVKIYWEEGMLTDDLWQKFNSNDNYATFTVLDYVKEFTSSRMVARKGTVKPIYRPTVEMPKKMITMFRAAQRNKFKRVMVPQLAQANPDIAKAAPMKFNGKYMEPQPPKEDGYQLITWREKGQTVGAHVQTRWAEALEQNSPAMGDAILASLNWGFRHSVYKLIIQFNPNFQLFTGPVKDFGRALVNQPGGIKGRLALIRNMTKDVLELAKSRDGRRVLLEFSGTSLAGIAGATGGAALGSAAGIPGMAIGGVVAGNAASYAGFFVGRMAAAAIETLPWLPDDPSASMDWARGDLGRNALMREMIENYAISGPWAYLGRGVTTGDRDSAIEAIMGKFHVGGESKPLPWIYRQIANYFNDVELAGQVIQNIPKTSSYAVNTRTLGMPKTQAAYWVRNHIGLPNTAKKGKHIGNFQALAPFANIFIRSFESMGKLIGNKEAGTMSNKEFILAYFLLGFGALQILQRMAKEGMLGDDLAKAYAGASEYDVTNKFVFPLGQVDSPTGPKSALLTVPLDDNHRVIGSIMSKITKVMCRMAQGRSLDIGGLDILTGFSASMPGVNPVLSVADKWSQFFSGNAPVDHRNQPIISDDEQKAGGLYALKPMLGWTLNETGASNFFKYDPRANTFTEAAINSVPAFNRFLKITDTGSRENIRQAEMEKGVIKAKFRLDMPSDVTALRQEYFWLRTRGEARTMREEDRYHDLQQFETFFQKRLEEADTAQSLGRNREAQQLLQEISRESKLYRQR